ncbi:MAG: high-potential iron-sulfur protein [Oligoflexia bacterium]|nr:high-potential iron-sulfur protein [Oligoflexia bacterium]
MKLNRRDFIKWTTISAVAIPLAHQLGGNSFSARAADGLPLIKEDDPMAKNLKYCENADKPTKQCADRKKKERNSQYCNNCQLYTKVSGANDNETGKCMIMPKNSVKGKAWCMSWVKKP